MCQSDDVKRSQRPELSARPDEVRQADSPWPVVGKSEPVPSHVRSRLNGQDVIHLFSDTAYARRLRDTLRP